MEEQKKMLIKVLFFVEIWTWLACTILVANSVDDKLTVFFLENRFWHFVQIVS